MIYGYTCPACKAEFDVVKSVKDIDREEPCKKCSAIAVRQFFPQKIHISGAKVEHAEWNPALGAVVKNSKHRAELAKRKGLVEVGNDYGSGEKMQAAFEKKREEAREKRWEDD